jgi:hypothetical protein
MKLKDIGFYPPDDKHAEPLKWGSYAVALHFLVSLPDVVTKDTRKISIRPIEDGVPSTRQLLDVLRLTEPFDFTSLDANDPVAIKRALLELLRRAVARGAREKGWSQQPFDEAYEKVLSDGILLERSTGRRISSPDKKHKAQLWYCVDTFKTAVGVQFFDATGSKTGRKQFVEIEPTWIALRDTLGKLSWITSQTVELTAKTDSQSWRADVPNRPI